MPTQFDELIPNAKAARCLGGNDQDAVPVDSPAGFELPRTVPRKQSPILFRGADRCLAGEPHAWGSGTNCAFPKGQRSSRQ